MICWKNLTMPYKTFLSTYSMYKILLLFFCFISLLFNFLRGFLLNLGLKAYVLLLINVISLLIILDDCYTIVKKHWIYLWIWPFFAVTIMHILQNGFVTVKRKVKLSYHKNKLCCWSQKQRFSRFSFPSTRERRFQAPKTQVF